MNESDLIARAVDARNRAYAPYSKYRVGAAIRTDDGRIFVGCNVENASYGLSLCAERVAAFSAIAATDDARPLRIVAVAVATDDGGTPCGACRQVLSEFAAPDGVSVVLIDNDGCVVTRTTLAELLPMAFAL